MDPNTAQVVFAKSPLASKSFWGLLVAMPLAWVFGKLAAHGLPVDTASQQSIGDVISLALVGGAGIVFRFLTNGPISWGARFSPPAGTTLPSGTHVVSNFVTESGLRLVAAGVLSPGAHEIEVAAPKPVEPPPPPAPPVAIRTLRVQPPAVDVPLPSAMPATAPLTAM